MKLIKKWKTIIYIAVGIVLLILTIATGTYGLPSVDREIYAEAIKLDEKVKGLGFNNFSVQDYKVRFFDGNSDYVIHGDNINKEKAAFETFVGTTVEVDGEFQVLLPTYEKFSEMFSVLATAESMTEGTISFEEDEYSINSHIATLWHEAFHTWQFTDHFSELNSLALAAGLGEGSDYLEILQNEVDSNNSLVKLFEEEMKVLIQVWQTETVSEKRDLLEQCFALQKEREGLLSEQAVFIEQYYETVEGSAQYVESQIYKELEGQEAWEETYMSPFVYVNGAGKYYTMGRLKCMILDQIAPDWKQSFDATVNLNTSLQQALEKM